MTKQRQKKLDKCPKKLKEQLIKILEELLQRKFASLDIKELKWELKGHYRCRKWDIRIIYEDKWWEIIIKKIDSRWDIYK